MKRILPALLALSTAGCIARATTAPLDAPVRAPGAWSSEATGSEVAAPDRWWMAFEDPELNRLIDRVLGGNLELRQAKARLGQALALAGQVDAAKIPQVNVSLGASRARTPAPSFNLPPGVPAPNTDATTDRFSATLGGVYEIDAWGRIEALSAAAEHDARAAREAMETVAAALAARVADGWYGLVEARARQAVLARQLETNRTFEGLVLERFEQGMASIIDVHQQRQQVHATESQMPLVEAAIHTLGHQLNVLLGEAPGTSRPADRSELPEPPPPPATGLPSELLVRRPDLRAAEARVIAQDRRVAAAIADRFPAVRLTGSMGYQARDMADLLDNFIWSIAADMVAPIIDGGRRKAAVARERARLDELLAGYGQALLQALADVEGSLRLEASQRAHLEATHRRFEVARLTLTEARNRYLHGLSDYLPVLNALRSSQEAELAVLSGKRLLLSHRIRLYQALGGDWTKDLGREPKEGS